MRVNEIFYSLQGEGHYTGWPAVFIRLAGCNLRCSFCDTEFESFTEMTEDEIVAKVLEYPTELVVVTGGEPTLQLTTSLLEKLNKAGRLVNIETNGTHPLPNGPIHWVTCSPKTSIKELHIQHINELKVVYQGQDMTPFRQVKAQIYSLQPCDTGDAVRNEQNLQATIDYILQHPEWKLSLQTHKMIHVK